MNLGTIFSNKWTEFLVKNSLLKDIQIPITTTPTLLTSLSSPTWGAQTDVKIIMWRDGKFMRLMGKFTIPTITANTSLFTVPDSKILDLAFIDARQNILGHAHRLRTSGGLQSFHVYTGGTMIINKTVEGTGQTFSLSEGSTGDANEQLAWSNASSFLTVGDRILIDATLPIAGWEQTQTLAEQLGL